MTYICLRPHNKPAQVYLILDGNDSGLAKICKNAPFFRVTMDAGGVLQSEELQPGTPEYRRVEKWVSDPISNRLLLNNPSFRGSIKVDDVVELLSRGRIK